MGTHRMIFTGWPNQDKDTIARPTNEPDLTKEIFFVEETPVKDPHGTRPLTPKEQSRWRRTRLLTWGKHPIGEPPDRKPNELSPEDKLIYRYSQFLKSRGHESAGLRIVFPNVPTRRDHGVYSLECDLFDKTGLVLVEAKGDTGRGSVRMAVGQLLDYEWFIEKWLSAGSIRLAALLPRQPRGDLVRLLRSSGIEIVWENPDKSTFNTDG